MEWLRTPIAVPAWALLLMLILGTYFWARSVFG
jgi:hypothetical protein